MENVKIKSKNDKRINSKTKVYVSMKKDAYLKLPRSLFSSEGWQKATYEQMAVLIDLCFRAAFVEHEVEVSREKVVVHEGQLIMTQA